MTAAGYFGRVSKKPLTVSLKCPADDQKWPVVAPQCLRCSATPPARYRGRGLCAPCHKQLIGTDELRRYKKIPKDLRNVTLRRLYANPRRWLQQALGDTHARLFEDHEILAEALRVFRAFVLRWYRRTCYVYDPKVRAEEVVSQQVSSYEPPLEDDGGEPSPTPEAPAAPVEQVDERAPHIRVLEELRVFAPGVRLVWDLRRWSVIYGDRYIFLRVDVPHSGAVATYEYQNDLRREAGFYDLEVVKGLIGVMP